MKALIVCTSHSTFPTKSQSTGIWLGELTAFFNELARKKIRIDLASPRGGAIPVDPRSADNKEADRVFQNFPILKSLISNSIPLNEIHPQEYQIVYLTGGHGALWDFPDNIYLQNIIRSVFESGGWITGVGHGLSALLNVKTSDGVTLLIKDKYLTSFTNIEDNMVSLFAEIPFSLEERLRDRGVIFTKALLPFVENIEMDERLITGQNPNSARKVALKLLEEVSEK